MSKPSSTKSGSTKTVDESVPAAEGVVIAMVTISVPRRETMKVPLTNLQRRLVMGRDPRSDLLLDDEIVSRLHAVITRERDRFFVEDLDSKNGTVLNGRFLRSGKPMRLAHGDEIRIGPISILFESRDSKTEGRIQQPPSIQKASSDAHMIPTGYTELDAHLNGGLPEGYAILLLSPSCDERDLLLERIVKSSIASGRPTVCLSCDAGKTNQFLERFPTNFYGMHSQADKIAAAALPNLFNIPGVENLSEFNISISAGIAQSNLNDERSKVMVVDALSDILLRHKGVITRRWLSDFVAKRKAQSFTILATLNPLIAPESDVNTVIDVFDGVMTIDERKHRGSSATYLTIKKLYLKRYSPTDLLLDKEKLF